MLKPNKKDDEDYLTFSSVVNKHCDEFKLADLSAVDFKCLIFCPGTCLNKSLRNPTKSFKQIGEWAEFNVEKLAEDRQRIISMKKDSRDIEESGVTHVRNLHKKTTHYSLKKNKQQNNKERTLSPSQTGKTS